MKIIRSLAALALFVSFNVHAIPPPPPLPKPIGYLSAKLKVNVSATQACNDMICPHDSEFCDFTVKVPVVAASTYDEGYNSPTLLDLTTKKPVSCNKVFEGLNHQMGLSAYATLDSKGLVKVISRTYFGKAPYPSTGRELSLSGGNYNVTILSQASPVLTVRSSTNESINFHQLGGQPPAVANTRSSVTTALEFSSLQLEGPTP